MTLHRISVLSKFSPLLNSAIINHNVAVKRQRNPRQELVQIYLSIFMNKKITQNMVAQ